MTMKPKLKFNTDFIYPVICKKYLILLHHDYQSVDEQSLENVKQKYKKRIERFNNYIRRNDLEIVMIFNNIDFNLNEWQKSVYDKFNIDIELLKKDNEIYIERIKELYKDHENIKIKSLEETFLNQYCIKT